MPLISNALATIMNIKGYLDARKDRAEDRAELGAYRNRQLELQARQERQQERQQVSEEARARAADILEEAGAGMDQVLAAPPERQADTYAAVMDSLQQRFPGFDPTAVGLSPQFDPQQAAVMRERWRRVSPAGRATPKPPSLTAHDPTKDLIDPQTGKVVRAATPAAPTAPSNLDAAILEAERRGDQAAVERYMGLKERVAKAGRAPAAPEPLVPIMGPDGPVLVPLSQASGKRPASTREQGRPVTSGDAGQIAELDTSIDDLTVLRQTVADIGATGTAARIGAAMPNVVTEATGWGADAKSKQAVIDRVKQVIGKALEGGVLRKEDEYKYTKILPTIGDVPEVVETKLAGLEKAIALRKQRLIESLTDAGYDTSKFTERTAGAVSTDKKNPFR